MNRSARPFPLWVPYAIGAIVVLLDFMGSYARFLLRPDRTSYDWWFSASPIVASPLVWAAAVPVIHRVYRILSARRSSGHHTWSQWVAFVIVGAALHESLVTTILLVPYFFEDPESVAGLVRHFVPTMVWWWTRGALQLIVILGAFVGLDIYRNWRVERIAKERVQAQLAEAQLDALRLQLNPHFLFNTLHTVGSLMERSVEDAQSVLAKLANLLRRMLETRQEPLVSLDRELDLIRDYLDIEQVRFQDRLTVEYSIASAARAAIVPSLILQPLAENAIKHGFSKSSHAGTIMLDARVVDERLELTVSDDGRGGAAVTKTGIGLANTRDRLEQLYGSRGSLETEQLPARGYVARIRIPFVPESSEGEVGR